MKMKISMIALAFAYISVPVQAQSLSVPFAIQATFPNVNLGALGSTGTWTISGTGTWLLNAAAGTDTQSVTLTVNLPGLNQSLSIPFTATGLFKFARETATNRIGILAETQGTLNLLPGLTINLLIISAIDPMVEPTFPPFPTNPPSPLSLPPLPLGFTSLPVGDLPQLNELGNTGTFLAAATATVVLLPMQDLRGIGSVKIVPSNAACPSQTSSPLTLLTGTWTFDVGGQAPLGTTVNAAGQFTAAMSTVNETPVGIVSVTQSLSSATTPEIESGSYQVSADCSGGTLAFNIGAQPIEFHFWFDDKFGEIRFVSTTANAAIRGSAKRF